MTSKVLKKREKKEFYKLSCIIIDDDTASSHSAMILISPAPCAVYVIIAIPFH